MKMDTGANHISLHLSRVPDCVLAEKVISEFCKGGLRSDCEPVYVAAVYETWKLPEPVAQTRADWGEADYKFQVQADVFDEAVPAEGFRGGVEVFVDPHLFEDDATLFGGVKVGDFAGVEEVVDVFEEDLVGYV